MNKSSKRLIAFLLAGLLVACGSSSSGGGSAVAEDFSVKMELPDSLTGGNTNNASRRIAGKIAEVAERDASNESCSYLGPENEDDPFRNGYETSRFMISIMATWTCIADLLIDLSNAVPHDGIILETGNDSLSPAYQADEPTHFSVIDETGTQVTLRLYYGYPRSAPPHAGTAAQFYISWNKTAEEFIQGRMIIDARAIDAADRKDDDPDMMRMDFDFTPQQRQADMYLRFDNNNPWANGFRIQVIRDDTANPLGRVFTARGLIDMNAQFLPLPGIGEIPQIQFFTVSDLLGNGAAIEEIQDLALPLIVNIFQNNHLGRYLFTKRDIYFFEDDQDWEYINKTVTGSQYRGARNTVASGGSWLPFNPSLDMISAALALDSDYFIGNKCAQLNDDCNQLLNEVFVDGFADQEKNQGSDPMDWRSTALAAATYLDSVTPTAAAGTAPSSKASARHPINRGQTTFRKTWSVPQLQGQDCFTAPG